MISLVTEEYWWLASPNRPKVPTRQQICSIGCTFQGLTISTKQFGTQPWFELAYQCLSSAADRASVRAQKKAAGDTHLILEFYTHQQSIYDEPGQPWQHAISPSGEANPQWFLGLVAELRQDGLIPIVVFDGDNGDNPMDGWPNAARQLPLLVDLLGAWNDQMLYARFWDGVFYGSTPGHIADFGQQFRDVLPNGYLAIEHQPGRIPVGNGPADYAPGGLMVDYDVICSEFDWLPHNDATWQVAARLLGPAYVRPPDQPAHDDPSPPWYLRTGSSRGPYFTWAMEYAEYQWVRSQVTAAEIQTQRQYFRNMGYTAVG